MKKTRHSWQRVHLGSTFGLLNCSQESRPCRLNVVAMALWVETSTRQKGSIVSLFSVPPEREDPCIHAQETALSVEASGDPLKGKPVLCLVIQFLVQSFAPRILPLCPRSVMLLEKIKTCGSPAKTSPKALIIL